MKRRYFPGLNALRFYAALCVVIQHLSSYTVWFNTPASRRLINFFFLDGEDAVGLFFVLSGFLITYLLLSERQQQGSIDIPRFYARRALRIWPLYYLAVALCFVVLPLITRIAPDASALPAILILMPNVANGLAALPGAIHPLWSIGTEEQFYLIWPLLMRRVRRWLPALCLIIIVVRPLLGVLSYQFANSFWLTLIDELRFESMALGALGAYLLFYQHAALRWIYHPVVRALAILILLIDIPLPLTYGIPSDAVPVWNACFSLVALILILNLTASGWRWLEHPALNALGTVSYGIYVYHAPVIYLVLYALVQTGVGIRDVIYFPASIVLTIAAAIASYRWIEKPFLRRKPQPAPAAA